MHFDVSCLLVYQSSLRACPYIGSWKSPAKESFDGFAEVCGSPGEAADFGLCPKHFPPKLEAVRATGAEGSSATCCSWAIQRHVKRTHAGGKLSKFRVYLPNASGAEVCRPMQVANDLASGHQYSFHVSEAHWGRSYCESTRIASVRQRSDMSIRRTYRSRRRLVCLGGKQD